MAATSFFSTRRGENQADPDANSDSCRKAEGVEQNVGILAANGSGRSRHPVGRGLIFLPGNVVQIFDLLCSTVPCAFWSCGPTVPVDKGWCQVVVSETCSYFVLSIT